MALWRAEKHGVEKARLGDVPLFPIESQGLMTLDLEYEPQGNPSLHATEPWKEQPMTPPPPNKTHRGYQAGLLDPKPHLAQDITGQFYHRIDKHNSFKEGQTSEKGQAQSMTYECMSLVSIPFGFPSPLSARLQLMSGQ